MAQQFDTNSININLLVQNMHNYTWLVDNYYLAQHFHLDSSYKLNIIDHTFSRDLLAQRSNYVILAMLQVCIRYCML